MWHKSIQGCTTYLLPSHICDHAPGGTEQTYYQPAHFGQIAATQLLPGIFFIDILFSLATNEEIQVIVSWDFNMMYMYSRLPIGMLPRSSPLIVPNSSSCTVS